MKYKLLRNSATDQRVWQDQAGNIYLADHSGDHDGLVGRPDQTEDGPLMLANNASIPPLVGGAVLWRADVIALRSNSKMQVGFGHDVARYLADLLKVPLKIAYGKTVYTLTLG